MELRRRLMSYGRSPSRNGEKKLSITSPSESPEIVKSPRLGPFSPGSSSRKALKNLFVKKKSRSSPPASSTSESPPESPPESVKITELTPPLSRRNGDVEHELTDVFQHFDVDGDGKISADELRNVLVSLGEEDLSEEELTAMIKEADSNGDGYIDLTDFIRLNTGSGFDKDSELFDAFNLFDVDKKGCITAQGLHEIMTRLGEESSLDDCHMMIKRVDSDGDGVVNFCEFKQMMMT
ncbi:hypothetical protein SUGI_0879890 [Cryptomeria japonica]|uniref:probable calcium-binding protein CML23 n=1 Tax=Cryptomeria japonica TaxID=3369 RepID=UPI0024146CB3|nr:probable calcium-binding protein CML23 [Cryptomeria japonica]GLJ42456.1 hypothetical protein SUGI_0879890 [Cryptomeria japonica]